MSKMTLASFWDALEPEEQEVLALRAYFYRSRLYRSEFMYRQWDYMPMSPRIRLMPIVVGEMKKRQIGVI